MTRKKKASSTERVRRYRKRKRDQGLRQHIAWVPFSGLSKIGTQRVKRKNRMLPRKTKSTWLKKPPKRGKLPKRKNTF